MSRACPGCTEASRPSLWWQRAETCFPARTLHPRPDLQGQHTPRLPSCSTPARPGGPDPQVCEKNPPPPWRHLWPQGFHQVSMAFKCQLSLWKTFSNVCCRPMNWCVLLCQARSFLFLMSVLAVLFHLKYFTLKSTFNFLLLLASQFLFLNLLIYWLIFHLACWAHFCCVFFCTVNKNIYELEHISSLNPFRITFFCVIFYSFCDYSYFEYSFNKLLLTAFLYKVRCILSLRNCVISPSITN